MGEASSEPSIVLDYAPRPRLTWRRLRPWFRLSIASIIILAIWYWRSPIWRHAQILYWQRQCMAYTAPPDQKIPQADHYTPATQRAGPNTPWGHLTALAFPRNQSFTPCLFLHRIRSRKGVTRLVAISHEIPFQRAQFAFEVVILEPATLITPPRIIYSEKVEIHHSFRPGEEGLLVQYFPRTKPSATVFAGQLDPSDPSHFTVRFLLQNKPGQLDVRLFDDGSSLEFNVTGGPRDFQWFTVPLLFPNPR